MATFKNKRKLAAMAKGTSENPRDNQSQNSAAPGNTEELIAQFFEEIEGRVTRNYPRISPGHSPASWALCPS